MAGGLASSDDLDYDPGDAEQQSPAGGKRKQKEQPKDAGKPRKRLRRTPVPLSDISEGRIPTVPDEWASMDLDAIETPLGEEIRLLNTFVNSVRKKEGVKYATYQYTPELQYAQSILDLPFYNDVSRHYELVEDEVALYEHTAASGQLTTAWRLRARHLRKPSDEPVALFCLHNTVRPGNDDLDLRAGVNYISEHISQLATS